MRKQKDDLIGEISQIESHNKKLTDFLVKSSTSDNPAPLNMPILQTFQSNNNNKTREASKPMAGELVKVGVRGVG